jgi:glycosyltransferase involved in cell wall biosynthesis
MKVCQISCRMNIDDSRQTRVRDAIIASGAHVVSIMTTPRAVSHHWEGTSNSRVILPRTPDIFHKGTVSYLIPALWSRLRNFVKAFAAAVRAGPDAVHCIEPDSWLIGMFLKCFYGAAFIVDFEEMYEERGRVLPRPLRTTFKYLLQSCERIAFRYADAVIHVSENRKAAYAAMPVKRAIVVSHYASSKDFEVQADLRPPELEGKLIALHAGALRDDYAGRELLFALKQASESVSRLVGVVLGGIAHHDSAYADLVQEMTQDGRLVLKPHLSFAQVVQHMKMSDIGLSLILPLDRNLQLAFPRKLFEYLAAGLPVIASEAPDIRDVVERCRCGLLVDARKPQQIADAIIKLAQNCALRKSMAENAAKAARTAYDWQAQAAKVSTLYRELALSKSPPRWNGEFRTINNFKTVNK